MKNKALLELLKDKYGITTLAELDKAIADLKLIDLSPFVNADERNKKESQNEQCNQ